MGATPAAPVAAGVADQARGQAGPGLHALDDHDVRAARPEREPVEIVQGLLKIISSPKLAALTNTPAIDTSPCYSNDGAQIAAQRLASPTLSTLTR